MINFYITFTGGDQRIVIRASGTRANGEDPKMKIGIIDHPPWEGEEKYVYYSDSMIVDASVWKNYIFTIEMPCSA